MFIYVLLDPREGNLTCYVGKTKDPKTRYARHLSERSRTRKSRWIQHLAGHSLKPEMQFLEEVEDNWKQRERFWIQEMRDRGFTVVNHTGGGDGPEFGLDDEARKRLSDAVKRRFFGDAGEAYRQRVSEATTRANLKRATEGKYKPLSDAHREKLRAASVGNAARKGMTNSETTRLAISLANKGKPKSEEWKRKASEAATKRWAKVRLQKQTAIKGE